MFRCYVGWWISYQELTSYFRIWTTQNDHEFSLDEVSNFLFLSYLKSVSVALHMVDCSMGMNC